MADYTESATFELGMASSVDRDCVYQRAIAITSNEWVSPTGHSDPDSEWTNEANAYDGDTGTVATGGSAHYLELTIDSIACDKVRVYLSGALRTSVDVYYGADWHEIADETLTQNAWVELAIGSTQSVTAARVKATTVTAVSLHEFEFNAISTIDYLGLGLAASVNRSWGRGRTSTLGLGLAATITRAASYLRTATEGLGLAVSASRGFFEAASLTIGLAVTVDHSLRDLIAFVKGSVKRLYKVVAEVKHLYTTKGDEW